MNKNEIEKNFAFVGLGISILLIIVGFCLLLTPSTVNSYYGLPTGDSSLMELQMSTVYKVSEVVHNLNEIGDAMSLYAFLFFVFTGLISGCLSIKKIMLINTEECIKSECETIQEEDDFWECKKCWKKNKAEDDFCSYCGSRK